MAAPRRVLAVSAVAVIGGITALSGCSPTALRAGRTAPEQGRVEHLDPALAFHLLKASPRRYQIVPGRLRADSLIALFAGETPTKSWDLFAGAADVWNEASMEIVLGNFARAADLYRALVATVPGCSDCRIELARALLGMAAKPGRTEKSAEELRRDAADQLLIASSLDPEVPIGRGIYSPPDWLGRTNIPQRPAKKLAQRWFTIGNQAYDTGDFAAARRAYIEAMRQEPGFARCYVAIGDTYYDQRNWKAASQWYANALTADSTDFLAWRSLAECYEALGLTKAAFNAAIWAVIYNYQDAASWETLSRIALSQGYSVSRCRLDKRVEVRRTGDGAVRITVDSALHGPEQTAWLGYGFIRTVWRYEGRFSRRHPKAPRYRPTFDEETEATAALAAIWATSLHDSTVRAMSNRQLGKIWRIAEAGYLAEYVIFEEMAADNPDIITHLSAPILARIREYVERFIIGGLAL